MKSFENSSFKIRVKKVRQLTAAFSLHGIFTRSIMAKYANSEYVELENQYKTNILKIAAETDIDVHIKNDIWTNIPVRTPASAIEQILRNTYEKQNTVEEDFVEQTAEEIIEVPVEEESEQIEAPLEEVYEEEPASEEVIEEETVTESTEETETVEEVVEVPVEVVPAQPRIQTTNVQQNNNYHNPRNNNYNQQKKK